jgi:U3 small nucleolar RNA-associated protein 10
LQETLRSALISRLQDSALGVIEALYENPAAVTPIFCGDPKSFVASLYLAIASQEKLKRNIVKLHLLYLASHFWPAAEASTHDEIFHRLLFPFFLFTKSRQKTAELVWDLVGERFRKATKSSALDWIDGCDALVKTEMAKAEQTDAVELMNQINFSISSKIAGELQSTFEAKNSRLNGLQRT